MKAQTQDRMVRQLRGRVSPKGESPVALVARALANKNNIPMLDVSGLAVPLLNGKTGKLDGVYFPEFKTLKVSTLLFENEDTGTYWEQKITGVGNEGGAVYVDTGIKF